MSLRHRLSRDHGSRRSMPPPQQQQQQHHQPQPQSPNAFDSSFHYLPSVMDGLSVDLGHQVGYFDSVKGSMRQIYHLLIVALCRHDPLPGMVRGALDSLVTAGARPQPQPQPQPPLEQQRSDIETITALDIPYTLRHFDFDLSTMVNNSEGSAGATAGCGGGGGGSVTFTVSDAARLSGRGSGSGSGGGFGVRMRACRLVADLLVSARVSSTVRRSVQEAATPPQPPLLTPQQQLTRRRRVGDDSRSSSATPAGTYAPPNSAMGASPATSSAAASASAAVAAASSSATSKSSRRSSGRRSSRRASSSESSSPPASPSTSLVGGRSGGVCVVGTTATLSLTAPLLLTVGLDGSNSNRATATQQSQQLPPQPEGRLCPLHSERSGPATNESSCAVCASQHFLHRHLQRLSQESGGLARLEEVLCDCLQLQEQWRRSVHWVAGSVKDKRLPETLRPLIRCICTDAVGCEAGGGVRGVTVNPQIIISTDGHCSALQCVSRCSGGGGGVGGGGGGGGGASSRWGSVLGGGSSSANCCWDTQASASKEAQ